MTLDQLEGCERSRNAAVDAPRAQRLPADTAASRQPPMTVFTTRADTIYGCTSAPARVCLLPLSCGSTRHSGARNETSQYASINTNS